MPASLGGLGASVAITTEGLGVCGRPRPSSARAPPGPPPRCLSPVATAEIPHLPVPSSSTTPMPTPPSPGLPAARAGHSARSRAAAGSRDHGAATVQCGAVARKGHPALKAGRLRPSRPCAVTRLGRVCRTSARRTPWGCAHTAHVRPLRGCVVAGGNCARTARVWSHCPRVTVLRRCDHAMHVRWHTGDPLGHVRCVRRSSDGRCRWLAEACELHVPTGQHGPCYRRHSRGSPSQVVSRPYCRVPAPVRSQQEKGRTRHAPQPCCLTTCQPQEARQATPQASTGGCLARIDDGMWASAGRGKG